VKIPLRHRLGIAWTLIAVLLACGSFAGGDTSILCGFGFLLWTAPVGIIAVFYVYEYVLKVLPQSVVDPVGMALVILLAYIFWFFAIPRVLSAVRQSKR